MKKTQILPEEMILEPGFRKSDKQGIIGRRFPVLFAHEVFEQSNLKPLPSNTSSQRADIS
jgi:hypothetical protein